MGGWVKNGLTMHLHNILELWSKNIDYVLISRPYLCHEQTPVF